MPPGTEAELDSIELRQRIADLCLDGYYQSGGHYYPYWNHWGLYLDRETASTAMSALARIVSESCPDIDFLCPVPTSGFPIGAMLFDRTSVPVMASFHWKDSKFHAEPILKAHCRGLNAPPRACVVDSSVHTGASLYLCNKMIEECLGGVVTRVVAIVDNDLVPKDRLDPVKTDFAKNNRLHTLFRVSELERCWSGRVDSYIEGRNLSL